MKKIFFILLLSLCTYIANAQTCGTFKFIAQSKSGHHSAGIKTDGSLWTWGYNNNGQLGDGTVTERRTPVQIGTATNWIKVAVGGDPSSGFTIGLRADSTLWAWGVNTDGQLGDGTNTRSLVPKQIGSNIKFFDVAAGTAHVLALAVNSSNNNIFYAWGNNSVGQLGLGNTTNQNTPTQIGLHSGTFGNYVSIAAGGDHCIALRSDGFILGWGSKQGFVSPNNLLSPQFVAIGYAGAKISTGYGLNFMIKTDGTLWAFGAGNFYGNMGNGTTFGVETPVQIGTANNWKSVVSANGHTVALRADSTLWAWGYNINGQLGDGTTTNKTTPIQIGTAKDWAFVGCGRDYSYAVKVDGSLWSWGNNENGRLGDGTVVNKTTPVQISSNNNVAVGNSNLNQSLPISSTASFFTANSCGNLIATVQPFGANPITGNVVAKLWLQPSQPIDYVKRVYEITPDNNAATATGRVTLYYTQADFNDFNNQIPAPTLRLPQNSTDAIGIANIRIEKRGGTSSNNSGLPSTYNLTNITTIDPLDANIVWNNMANRWEVTFDVVGFSGFFAKTATTVLPLVWQQFSATINAQQYASLQWRVQEQNVQAYTIEKSNNGIVFVEIGSINSKGDGTNFYQFTDNNLLQKLAYYRIKQTDKDGKQSYSTILKLDNNTTIDNISVYPTITKGLASISVSNNKLVNTSIAVININGKVMEQIMLSSQMQQINISHLPKGMYFIQFENGLVRKIMKE